MNERDGAIPFQFRLWQTTLSFQPELPIVIDSGIDLCNEFHTDHEVNNELLF